MLQNPFFVHSVEGFQFFRVFCFDLLKQRKQILLRFQVTFRVEVERFLRNLLRIQICSIRLEALSFRFTQQVFYSNQTDNL
jgi:hypothetical protein